MGDDMQLIEEGETPLPTNYFPVEEDEWRELNGGKKMGADEATMKAVLASKGIVLKENEVMETENRLNVGDTVRLENNFIWYIQWKDNWEGLTLPTAAGYADFVVKAEYKAFYRLELVDREVEGRSLISRNVKEILEVPKYLVQYDDLKKPIQWRNFVVNQPTE